VSVIKRASQRGSGISIQSHLSLGGVRHEYLRPDLAPTFGGHLHAPEYAGATLLGLEPDLRDSPAYSEQRPRHLDEFPTYRLFGLFARLDTAVFAHNVVLARDRRGLQVPAIVVRRGCAFETLRGLFEGEAVPRYLEGDTGCDEVQHIKVGAPDFLVKAEVSVRGVLHLPFAFRAEPP